MNTYISVYEKAMPETLSLSEKLRLAVKGGFDGMEISVDESDRKLARVLEPRVRRDTLSALREAGVPVRTMCLSGQRKYPFGSRDGSVREKSALILRAAVDFSAEAGIRVIQIPGYDVWYEDRGEDTEAYFAEGLAEAVGYAASRGVTLAFETMENDFMNTVEKAMKYIGIVQNPYLQIYPDMGNCRNGTGDYIGDLKKGRGHIAAAHLKDTREGIFRDLELGAGRVDFVGCLAELLSQGVGIYNCEIWYDKKTDPLAYLQRNRQYIGGCFEKAREALCHD